MMSPSRPKKKKVGLRLSINIFNTQYP
jgi:tubulin polyglutamylase TTLL6/13